MQYKKVSKNILKKKGNTKRFLSLKIFAQTFQ